MTRASTLGILSVLATVGLLAFAPSASAIYMVTPLHIGSDKHEYEVGDEASFRVFPENETVAAEWADRTVQIRYSYDKNEGQAQGPDEQASNEGYVQAVAVAELKLDDKATASFTWTIPAEVDDRNVEVVVYFADEHVATIPIVIGDAEPRMYAMSGPAGGDKGSLESGGEEPTTTGGETPAAPEDDKNTVPAAGALALVGMVGAVAIGLSLVRRK